MQPTSPLLARIAKVQKEGRLSVRDADVLIDMLNAGRAQVEAIVSFAERYLPAAVELPRTYGPSLIADEAELAAARRRIKTDKTSAELWRELESENAAAMKPGDPAFVDWKRRANVKLWDRRHAHWPLTRTMQNLAWGGAIARDRKLSIYAAGILASIARHRDGWGPAHCNYGAPYAGWLNDNLLDLGQISLGSAITFDLVRSVLSRADRAEVAAYFEPYFHKALTYRLTPLHNPGHNYAPIGFGGVGLLALALFDEYPAHRRPVLRDVISWAQAYVTFALDHIAGDDGAPVEGSGYCSASLYYSSLFAIGLRRVLGRDLFKHPTLARFARYLALESLPGGGAFNNFNDNHYETNVGLWPMIARQTGDPIGDWIWLQHIGLSNGAARDRSFAETPYVILFRNPDSDALIPQLLKLPHVHHFPKLDHLVMRTGWDPDDLHVTFQCTTPRPHIHSQADRLNFTAYAMGERFVIDSGYGMVPIAGSTEVRRMGALAESHNQVLIDGVGQSHQKDVAAGSIEKWKQQGEWVWAVGEATGSYPSAKTAKRLLAVRLTADEPVIVQVDWLVPADGKEHEYTCLLHTDAGNQVAPSEAGVTTIVGARKGARLNVAYHTPSGGAIRVDEWLGHPRLRLASRCVEHAGLLVLSAGSVKKKAGKISWRDARGEGVAAIKQTKGKCVVTLPDGLSVTL